MDNTKNWIRGHMSTCVTEAIREACFALFQLRMDAATVSTNRKVALVSPL